MSGLIEQLGLAGRRVAVELNGEVLPAESWPDRLLAENDAVEVVHFVGGG